jgi:hypothetical protein
MTQTSKYDILGRFLSGRRESEIRMTFKDVEQVLGFDLPPSAREHPAWWSNNVGTNVAVKSWRNAGWRTARVDVPGEAVSFVRESDGVAEPPVSKPFVADDLVLPRQSFSRRALNLLEDYADATSVRLEEAAVGIIEAAALERRRRLIDEIEASAPSNIGSSSVDLIREDRDAR